MTTKLPEAKNPLILRFHRLMDAFAKSDDERDFYLDTVEGFLIFSNLDKSEAELVGLDKELAEAGSRYRAIPKMTFYETKKIMEGFVNEKVYDIDTKEKLLDLIGQKDPRENFLEFLYDQLTELEKWQLYYAERSRVRIIEWLRNEELHFVFEEDLNMLTKPIIEKLKEHLFAGKVPKDVKDARAVLETKAKTYYSNEALNPRPKRGRPPKQQQKVELEPQFSMDLFTTVPPPVRIFLHIPDITSASAVTFSTRFDTEAAFLASLRGSERVKVDEKLMALSERLESLRHLSSRLVDIKEITGEKEAKLLRAVSVPEDGAPKGRMMSVVKGFLPSKAKKAAAIKKAAAEAPKKRKVKTVTQIQKKKPKKK